MTSKGMIGLPGDPAGLRERLIVLPLKQPSIQTGELLKLRPRGVGTKSGLNPLLQCDGLVGVPRGGATLKRRQLDDCKFGVSSKKISQTRMISDFFTQIGILCEAIGSCKPLSGVSVLLFKKMNSAGSIMCVGRFGTIA